MCGKNVSLVPLSSSGLCHVCFQFGAPDDEQPLTASTAVLNSLENPVKGDLREPQTVMELLQECRAVLNQVLEHGTMGLEPARTLLLKLNGMHLMPLPSQVVLPREIVEVWEGCGFLDISLDTAHENRFVGMIRFVDKPEVCAEGKSPQACLNALAAALKEKEGV